MCSPALDEAGHRLARKQLPASNQIVFTSGRRAMEKNTLRVARLTASLAYGDAMTSLGR